MRSACFLCIVFFLFHCGDDDNTNGDPSSGAGGQGGAGGATTSGAGAGLTLDPEFGDGGVLHTQRGFDNDQIYAAARFADGSIVAAGTNYGLANVSEPIVVRFDPSGAPDASFGEGGVVVLTMGEFAWVTDVSIAGTGLLVTGYMFESIDAKTFVVKLDASGAVDPAFGDGGIVRVPNDYGRPWTSMAQSNDGDIALLSRIGSDELSLTRFTADGTPQGSAVTLTDDEPRALAFSGDDVLALSGDDATGTLRRVGPSGALVSSFGAGGAVALDFAPYALTVESDGTIWVGGSGSTLLSLSASGTPEMGFGSNGVVSFAFGFGSGYDAVTAIALSGDAIVVVGALVTVLPSRRYLGMAKVDATGAPLSFDDALGGLLGNTSIDTVAEVGVAGTGWWVAGHRASTDLLPPAPDETETFAMVLGADGAVDASYGEQGLAHRATTAPETLWAFAHDEARGLVVHGAEGGIANRGLLTRLEGDAIDTTFGTDGFARLPMAGASVVAGGGRFYVGGGFGLSVMATDTSGQLDSSFGMNGTAQILIDGVGQGLVLDLALDAEGRLMMMGEAVEGTGAFGLLARVLEDGSLDPSYGDAGVVRNPSGAGGFVGAGLMKADGSMVLSGQRNHEEAWIGRVDAAGAADPSFGNGGFTIIPEPVRIFRLIELADGGHIAAGHSYLCYGEDVCNLVLAKVDAAGALDAGFGDNGLVHLESSFYHLWGAIAELPDGSLVAGASTESGAYETPLTLWKLHADGSIDTGFGTDGAFTLPGKGRAIEAVIRGDRLLVGGYTTSADRGSHMVFLQFGM